MTWNEVIQIIAGFIGTLGFGVMFNIKGIRLWAVSVGGLLSWFLFCVFSKFGISDAINYFMVSFVVSLYAEIMARVLKTPTSAFTVTCLVPLVPGGSLYYTMAYAIGNNTEKFFEKAVYTLQLAAALALGIIIVTTATRIIFSKNKIKNYDN